MKMTGETKFFIGIIVATLAVLGGAVWFFSQPAKPIASDILVPQDAWATGSATPKATLVEFSDYECPSCIAAFPFVSKVVSENLQDLKFVYRHFPLEQHPQARFASLASEAAGKQGKFWEMHDLLFKASGNLSQASIASMAGELKLNMKKFTEDLAASDSAKRVDQGIIDGNKAKISATPTFFLNGSKLNLFNYADLEKEVKKALGKS
jgi:protein-disulfide isomerase